MDESSELKKLYVILNWQILNLIKIKGGEKRGKYLLRWSL